MNFKKAFGITVSTLALSLLVLGNANAKSFTVKCKSTATRSKISVDDSGLSRAQYRALVTSGGVTVPSKNLKLPVAGEVEFDFDSNTADVNAGATRVAPTFIKNKRVVGTVQRRNSNRTFSTVSSMATTCQ